MEVALRQDVKKVFHDDADRGDASSRRASRVAVIVAGAIFAGLSLWAGIASEGFLEADGCTHYLFARFAFEEPHYFVNVWGRPICTAVYAPGAALAELVGVRVTSLVMALACGWMTMRVARAQGYRLPALAFVFLLVQPLFFLHSFSELTEMPFATILIGAFWAYQARRWWVFSILAGLLPLSRPEGFGFIVLAALALIAHRRWWWLATLALPLVVWNHLGWWMWGMKVPWWRWLISEWPYAADSLYTPGYLVHFLALLPVIVSPVLFPFMWIGALVGVSDEATKRRSDEGEETPESSPLRRSVASSLRRFSDSHVARCQLLITLIPLLILAGHSYLYWRGKMASNGEVRYLLTVAPFWALLAAKGWEWTFAKFEWRHPLRWAALAAVVPLAAELAYPVLPLAQMDDWKKARVVADWYRSANVSTDFPFVCSAHPGVYFYLDISPSGSRSKEWSKATIESAPDGTILVWDPVYGVFNSDAKRSIRLQDGVADNWELFGFQRAGNWVESESMLIWLSPRTQSGEKLDLPLRPSDFFDHPPASWRSPPLPK